jgi:hypothetical protein
MFCGPGEELAVKAATDEEGQAVVAEGPYSGEKAAMPECVHGWWRDIETDGGTGLADVFVAKGCSKRQSDCAGNTGAYSQKDSLLQGVDGGHTLSLPSQGSGSTCCLLLVASC